SYDIGFSVSGGSMPASGTLELTTVGPSGPWTKIVDLTGLQSGAGKHAWTVTATPTTTAFVRLDVKDTSPTPQTAADTSNSAFTIVVPNNIVLDKVEITPATATVVVGKTAKFNAKAIDTKGAEIASATFTWVLSGNIGTLAPTGATADFTATTIGSGSIEVNAEFGADSRTAQAAVSVQAAASPPLGKVVLTPSSVSGSVGESVAIRARALDINGKEIIGAQFAWTVTGGVGTLDSTSGDQVNLALEQAGAGSVDVVASFEGKDVGAKATVTAKKPFVFPWELLLIVIGLLAAVVVAGMLFSWFRRKKREEERRQQAFIQRRYEQFQQSQYQSQQYGWGG
ncbi:MAG TPA: hypothetical protein VI893_04325, partial [Thermoplasmata archaeon]|nr:hypothetical protein [Thermoplasmata archaeon]